ncbi:hypothetical protein [Streptomyces sp. NPDC020298]
MITRRAACGGFEQVGDASGLLGCAEADPRSTVLAAALAVTEARPGS